jgi:hypothetical protein
MRFRREIRRQGDREFKEFRTIVLRLQVMA